MSWQFINRYCVGICIFLSIVSLIFIIYGHKYREKIQTKLKSEFIKLPATSIDWWSISHLILYGIFGFLIPNYHTTFFLIGTGFEIMEDALCNDRDTQLVDCRRNKSNILCWFSQNDDYWYGKWDDIFVNLLGYTLGSSIRTAFC